MLIEDQSNPWRLNGDGPRWRSHPDEPATVTEFNLCNENDPGAPPYACVEVHHPQRGHEAAIVKWFTRTGDPEAAAAYARTLAEAARFAAGLSADEAPRSSAELYW